MNSKDTIMVSIDSSTKKTGIAVFKNAVYDQSFLLDFESIKDSDERMKEMSTTIINVLNKYKPSIVVIEMTVVSRNAMAQRILTMLLGVVYGYCILNNTDFVSLRPTEWRSLVKFDDEIVPKGRVGLKEWSVNKVNGLYHIDVNDDEADAILIGLANIKRFEKLVSE